jgi:hypothetical protein
LTAALELEPTRGLAFVADPWSSTRIDRLGSARRIVWVNRPPAAR